MPDTDPPELRPEVIVPRSRQLTPTTMLICMSIAYMLIYIASAVIAFLPCVLPRLLPANLVP